MLSKIRKSNEGFTIIEVLIVLAIAGLILLIVFLAVPALQRNQRNTARKNDIGRVGGAVSEYYSNNNGGVPTSAANMTTVLNSAGSLSQYKATDALYCGGNICTGVQGGLTTAPSQLSNFRLVTGAKCNTAAGNTGDTLAGSSRQSAIQHMIETSGAPLPVCTDI